MHNPACELSTVMHVVQAHLVAMRVQHARWQLVPILQMTNSEHCLPEKFSAASGQIPPRWPPGCCSPCVDSCHDGGSVWPAGIRYIQENDYPVRGTYGYY